MEKEIVKADNIGIHPAQAALAHSQKTSMSTPSVTGLQVIPVAGRDSMLLNLSVKPLAHSRRAQAAIKKRAFCGLLLGTQRQRRRA